MVLKPYFTTKNNLEIFLYILYKIDFYIVDVALKKLVNLNTFSSESDFT